MRTFWQQLHHPIVGLSPMDGVTDASMREITAKHGGPAVSFTEFVPVETLTFAPEKFLRDLEYCEAERPVVAQLYGIDPQAFYSAAVVVAALGFDGVDVNMGCPAKSIVHRGCGAGLIDYPDRAKAIVRAVRAGVTDWANGRTIEELGLPKKSLALVRERVARVARPVRREPLPISVKTRIGIEQVVIEDWVQHLLEVEPAAITIHGRTLRQLYQGQANWEAIGRAAAIARGSDTLILGNGDVRSREVAIDRARTYGTDGTLIGRAAIGDPWVFRERPATLRDRLEVAMEHVRIFAAIPNVHFVRIRRPLHRYCRGFPGALDVRKALMQAPTAEECLRILAKTIDALEQAGLADQLPSGDPEPERALVH